jgi:hypothetical protein
MSDHLIVLGFTTVMMSGSMLLHEVQIFMCLVTHSKLRFLFQKRSHLANPVGYFWIAVSNFGRVTDVRFLCCRGLWMDWFAFLGVLPCVLPSKLGLRLGGNRSLGRIRLTSSISGSGSCRSRRTRGNSSKIIISLILWIVLFCQSNALIWLHIKPRLNILWYKFRSKLCRFPSCSWQDGIKHSWILPISN